METVKGRTDPMMDRTSRYTFPLSFALFSVIYFCVYLNILTGSRQMAS